ncbi:uracil-DNA glycosylase [uncultured Porphyromonas sp.]|uniref:uracil-DNA glycosylase n=1 Tax=uncultured Porphyromonas sp. TaxID=159274 RepID=UPI002609074B|nr:uracil-DNA glycosylase [uncultured Porphyromonas sp.]
MNVSIHPSWQKVLQPDFDQPYFEQITNLVRQAYATSVVYPPAHLIFNAFNLTPFDQVKVVLLGQDPYHGPGQAMGLSFSVPNGMLLPPSLQNIYKELKSDLGQKPPQSGDLTHWAEQGVLLLNSTLTVQAHQARSHFAVGWQRLTDRVIQLLSEERSNLVFILWGADAQRKAWMIDERKHKILKAPHPSPLSAYRGFFGSKPFSQTNFYLVSHHITPIQWVQ